MGENLSDFLIDLGSNPDRTARFTADPTGELDASCLTIDERMAVMAGDSQRIRDLLGTDHSARRHRRWRLNGGMRNGDKKDGGGPQGGRRQSGRLQKSGTRKGSKRGAVKRGGVKRGGGRRRR
jgi:hypothetical protein